MPKYLRALPDIRRIQDYLVARAEEAGVPVIESSSLENGVEKVVSYLLAEVESMQETTMDLAVSYALSSWPWLTFSSGYVPRVADACSSARSYAASRFLSE